MANCLIKETEYVIQRDLGYQDRPLKDEYFWKGVVTQIDNDNFRCDLIDVANGHDVELEYELNKLEDYQQKFVEPGAAFYLYLVTDNSAKQKFVFHFLRYKPPFISLNELSNYLNNKS